MLERASGDGGGVEENDGIRKQILSVRLCNNTSRCSEGTDDAVRTMCNQWALLCPVRLPAEGSHIDEGRHIYRLER